MPATPPARSNLAPLALGAAIVAGFFLPWTDVWFRLSGWSYATAGGHWAYFLVPLGGLALAAVALIAPRLAPAVGVAVGGAIVAWFGWNVATTAVEAYGWGMTMVVAGSVFAIAGALIGKPTMSAVGGFAMIGGFFAPWIDPGHISGYQLAKQNGLGAIAIAAWLVPIGGALAAYAAGKGTRGRAVAGLGGVVGMAAIAYLTYRFMGEIQALMGWGYLVVVGAAVGAVATGVRRVRRVRRDKVTWL